MRYLRFIFIFATCLSSVSEAGLNNIDIGSILVTKTSFWIYEVRSPRSLFRTACYTMNSSRGGGIGDAEYKYLSTLPKGAVIEVIDIVKKNKREWFYIVRLKEGEVSPLKDVPIVVFPLSMQETPHRGTVTKKTMLNPDLFERLVYPEN